MPNWYIQIAFTVINLCIYTSYIITVVQKCLNIRQRPQYTKNSRLIAVVLFNTQNCGLLNRTTRTVRDNVMLLLLRRLLKDAVTFCA